MRRDKMILNISQLSYRLSILYFVNRKSRKLHGICVDYIMLGTGLRRTTLYWRPASIWMWNFQFNLIIPFRFLDYIKLLSSRGKMQKGSELEELLNDMSCCYTYILIHYSSARAWRIVAGPIDSLECPVNSLNSFFC